MKIIKKGVRPEDLVYRATCTHCKTLMEFMASEGKVTHDQRDGSYVTVACPVCHHTCDANLSSGVPPTKEES